MISYRRFVMNKHMKLKRALLVCFIVSLVLIAAFAAVYVLSPMILGEGNAELIGPQLELDAKMIGQAFVFPFDSTQAAEFVALYSQVGDNVALIISVCSYVLSGLMLILLVLGIVYVCNKKKPLFCIYSLAILAVVYISYIEIVLGVRYLAMMQKYFNPEVNRIDFGILASAIFVLAILAFIAVMGTSIVGLIYAKKALEDVAEEEPEPATVAELAGDPEAVQESEELAPVPEDALIEKEPEPTPEEAEAVAVEEEEIPIEEEAAAPAVEPEPKEDKQHVEVNVNNTNPSAAGVDQASLASLLREVVRDIVRDEIARSTLNQPQQPQQAPNGNQTITGATFGGPLVVQYFNGGINGVAAPTPAVVENKSVEKVVEIHKEEPKPQPAPAPEVKEEAKPAQRSTLFQKKAEQPKPAEPAPSAPEAQVVEQQPAPEKKEYERLSFAERLLQSEQDVLDLYNELKNEILSYGVKSRISAVGDTFRLHKKMYVRITVAGKSLKLYFALNPADYANSTLPIQDASGKDMYQEIPLVFKVKSPLSVRRCKELIQDVMEKDGLEQGEIGKVNWVKELKAELAKEKK